QPDSATLRVGDAVDFDGIALGAGNAVLTGRPVAWRSSDTTVVKIAADGTATGVGVGAAQVTATIGAITASGIVRVVPAGVIRVRIEPDSLVMRPGAVAELAAVALDGRGVALTGRAVTWVSSDTTVAKVAATGTITAVAAGNARVTASVDGVSGTADVRVLPAVVARVTIQPDSLSMRPGGSGDLAAVAYDARGVVVTGRAVAWTSSNAAIATVSTTGTVGGVAEGSARITATVDGVTATAAVRILAPAPLAVVRVRVEPDSAVLNVGARIDLNAVALDARGNTLTGRAVTWVSSNTAVAAVSASGAVTALAEGMVQLTATVDGVSGSARVRVAAPAPPTPVAVARVRVQPDSAYLNVGERVDLSAVAMDERGVALTGRVVVWSTANAGIANVTAGGVVTAVAAGSVVIRATVDGVSGSATITVRAPAPPTPVAVARVRVQPDSAFLNVGERVDLSAVATDAQGVALTGRVVVWSTANAGIAIVTASGVVTAIAEGSAVIRATVDGVSGSATIHVRASVPPTPVAVASVDVEPDSLVLQAGTRGELRVAARDGNGNVLTGRAVVWSSSDARVATVAVGGVVTGAAEGTARITASVEGVSASATVHVRAPPPAPVVTVRVQPDSLVLPVGAAGDFSATAYDGQGNVLTGRVVAWASSDRAVATISAGGVVGAVAEGSTRIYATVDGVTGSAYVRVVAPAPAAVARVVVRPDSITLEVGAAADLGATAYDARGNVLTGRSVTWASTNAAVAVVGSGGVVSGVAEGSTRITATVDGVTGSASARVTAVAPPAVARVVVQPDSLFLDPGKTGDLNAIAYDARGRVLTGRMVTWTSASTSVATVGAGGTVTGVAGGTAAVNASVEGVTARAIVRVSTPPAPPPPPPVVATVRVQPDSLVLDINERGDFNAVAYDARGNVLTGLAVVWTSSNPAVATADWGGLVIGVAGGTVRVTATVDGVSGSATLRVRPLSSEIAALRVSPAAVTVGIGVSATLSAIATDSQGRVLNGKRATWLSLAPGLVRVDSAGRVTGLSYGSGRIRATVEGHVAYADVTVPTSAGPVIGAIQINAGLPARPRDRFMVQIFSVSDPDGVMSVHVTARAPDGVQTATCGMLPSQSYTVQHPGPQAMPWNCYLQLPENAQHGLWTLDPVTATDSRGNRTVLTGAQLVASRMLNTVTFQVENLTYDRIAPTLNGVTLSVTTGGYSNGWILLARLRVADVGSGVYSSAIRVASPGGYMDRMMTCATESPGVMLCRVDVSRAEAAGQVVITAVNLKDRAENWTSYTTAQLEAAGYQARIDLP
ncbi:MAG TPA: Ig-like domain-containing protein, partial [Longimicrobium sp.]|nr:Ig-like domain-containing protein [Longimicrobium sp.]